MPSAILKVRSPFCREQTGGQSILQLKGNPLMKSKNTITTRNTRQKDAIRAAFVETDRPLSPEEVLSYAKREVADVSIATVYRNLKALVEDGWLVPVQLPGEPARYELSGKEHHHHFLCNDCRKVYELEGCELAIKPKLPRGFRPLSHDLLLHGICAACVPKHV